MVWVQFIYFVVTLVLSIALSPKPQKPRAAALDDFEFPTAEEGRPIPVIFGEMEVTGANVLWYGDLEVKAIRKRSGFSKATVGYKYSVGFHLGLCHGEIDAVTRIAWDDKEAWTGNITANGSGTINAPDLFGGSSRGGGVQGDFDIAFGGTAQTANAYLTAQVGETPPAFRGIVSLFWKGGYIGNSEFVKPLSVRCKRLLKGWEGTVWYSSKLDVNGGFNPAHIVYQCMTDTRWGMGVPATRIDDVNFQEAADTLFDEDFGLHIIWNQSATIEQFVQLIMDHIGGGLSFNLATGKYQIALLRGNYDPDDLNEYDESQILVMDKYEKQALGETVNEVTLSYVDPATFKMTSITAQDLASVDSQGARIPAPVELKGIRDHDLANYVLGRELAQRTMPLTKVQFQINRAAWHVAFGDVFKLTWPQRQCFEKVFRVLKISKGTLQSNAITIEALEDIYQYGVGTGVSHQGNELPYVPPTTPPDTDDAGTNVISATTPDPPSAADGDKYIVPPGATGDWAGHEGEGAEWSEDDGGWEFFEIPDGVIVYVEDSGTTVQVIDGTPATFPIPETLSPDPSGSYTMANIVVDEYGRVIEASSSDSGGSVYADTFVDDTWYGYEGEISIDGMTWFPLADDGELRSGHGVMLGSDNVFRAIRGSTIGNSDAGDYDGEWAYTSAYGPAWDEIVQQGSTYYVWDGNRTFTNTRPIIYSSATGLGSWSSVGSNDLPIDTAMYALVYDAVNSRWLAFCTVRTATGPDVFKARVYRSTNLTAWTLLSDVSPTPSTDNYGLRDVARNGNNLVAALGDYNTPAVVTPAIAFSTDLGVTWSFPSLSAPSGSTASATISVGYDGSLYIATGKNWVARSVNGSSWTVNTSFTPFSGDQSFSVVSGTDGRSVVNAGNPSRTDSVFTDDGGASWVDTGLMPQTNRAEAIYYDGLVEASTVKDAIDALAAGGGGGGGGAGSIVYSNGAVPTGSTVSNTTTETAFPQTMILDSVTELDLGSTITIKAAGIYGTDAVAPTLRIRMKIDSTVVLDTTAFTCSGSVTNRGWQFEGLIIVTTAGASGQVEAQGKLTMGTGATTALVVHPANTAKVNVNMAADATISITAQWGAADADNTVSLRQLVVSQETVAVVVAGVSWDPATHNGSIALTNANLTAHRTTTGGWTSVRCTKAITTGKYYWEIEIDAGTLNLMIYGVARSTLSQTGYVGSDATSYGFQSASGGPLKWNNSASAGYGTGLSVGDRLCIAFDATNGRLWFGKNGTWMASGDPVAGTNASFTGITGTNYPAIGFAGNTETNTVAFAASDWAHAAPSGYGELTP